MRWIAWGKKLFLCLVVLVLDQTVTVQRGSVLDVRGPEWFCQPFGGVSPDVHDHLHCFERVKLQVVKTAPDRQLLNLLFVSRLVTVLDEGRSVWCHLQTSGA